MDFNRTAACGARPTHSRFAACGRKCNGRTGAVMAQHNIMWHTDATVPDQSCVRRGFKPRAPGRQVMIPPTYPDFTAVGLSPAVPEHSTRPPAWMHAGVCTPNNMNAATRAQKSCHDPLGTSLGRRSMLSAAVHGRRRVRCVAQ